MLVRLTDENVFFRNFQREQCDRPFQYFRAKPSAVVVTLYLCTDKPSLVCVGLSLGANDTNFLIRVQACSRQPTLGNIIIIRRNNP